MQDYTITRQVIEKLLNDNFSLLPIVFENERLTDLEQEHISIVVDGEIIVEHVAMGSDLKKTESEIIVQIFTALGTGTAKALAVATALDAVFNIETDGINFQEREFKSVGEKQDSPFYEHNLIVPYIHIYGQNDST